MWLIPDLRDFDSIDFTLFKDRTYVSNIEKFQLYKTESEKSVKYGLYNEDVLICYIWFTKVSDGIMTYEFHARDNYINKGLGYSVYKFIMTDEKQTIITDHLCTKSGLRIWQKLLEDPEIEIGMYDTRNNQTIFIDDLLFGDLFGNDHYHLKAKTC